MKRMVLCILIIILSCSAVTPSYAWGEIEDINKMTVGDFNDFEDSLYVYPLGEIMAGYI